MGSPLGGISVATAIVPESGASCERGKSSGELVMLASEECILM
jgi:hypothetical protein